MTESMKNQRFVIMARENEKARADLIHAGDLTTVAITDKQGNETMQNSYANNWAAYDVFTNVCIGLKNNKDFEELTEMMF